MTYNIVAAGLICLVFSIIWRAQPSYAPDEPRPISHWLPWLGHTINWARNRRSFFEWGDRKNGHEPYSVLIAGRKHYVFGRPADVAALYRKSKTLSIRPFVELLFRQLFGMQKKDVESYTAVVSSLHELNNKYLLRPEYYNPVVATYFSVLRPMLQNMEKDIAGTPDDFIEKDALNILLDTMAPATTQAYFGLETVQANPRVGRDMEEFFSGGFWPALAGAPSWYYRNALRARDRIKSAILRTVMNPAKKPEDTSLFVREVIKLLTPVMSNDGIAVNEFSFVFGFTSNSIPTAYNVLLRILTTPNLIPSLRAEIASSGFATASPAQMSDIVPAGLPLLRSCYYESIRMHTVGASIREVMEPTEVVTKSTADAPSHVYQLKKGGVVNMPPTMLHYNPAINPDPETFHPRRFLSKDLGGEGHNSGACTRGFGGGTSYCPGRVFAERQIIGFLAMFFLSFETEFVDQDFVIPRTNEFDDVAKSRRARLRLRRREMQV